MSNLDAAKAAIEAELSHAKKGFSFYHARIEALEKTLSQLASVTGSGSSTAKSAVVADSSRIAGKRAKAAKSRKGAKEASGGNELPFTGGDYWTSLVLEQPRSVSEILEAAIAKLGFAPTKIQAKKLAGRMTFALNALVKAKKIQDSGSGRERRFFKA